MIQCAQFARKRQKDLWSTFDLARHQFAEQLRRPAIVTGHDHSPLHPPASAFHTGCRQPFGIVSSLCLSSLVIDPLTSRCHILAGRWGIARFEPQTISPQALRLEAYRG